MRLWERLLGRKESGELKCSVCRATDASLAERVTQAGIPPIAGAYVRTCPTCGRAFCARHVIPDDLTDFMDSPKCPKDRTALPEMLVPTIFRRR
jgi:hypothetical protein